MKQNLIYTSSVTTAYFIAPWTYAPGYSTNNWYTNIRFHILLHWSETSVCFILTTLFHQLILPTFQVFSSHATQATPLTIYSDSCCNWLIYTHEQFFPKMTHWLMTNTNNLGNRLIEFSLNSEQISLLFSSIYVGILYKRIQCQALLVYFFVGKHVCL